MKISYLGVTQDKECINTTFTEEPAEKIQPITDILRDLMLITGIGFNKL